MQLFQTLKLKELVYFTGFSNTYCKTKCLHYVIFPKILSRYFGVYNEQCQHTSDIAIEYCLAGFKEKNQNKPKPKQGEKTEIS